LLHKRIHFKTYFLLPSVIRKLTSRRTRVNYKRDCGRCDVQSALIESVDSRS
jgi:hypothetical protein